MISKTQRRALTLAAALAVAAGGSTVLATAPAGATPTGCTAQFKVDSNGTDYGVRAICTGGTGHYRVYATCTDELRGSSGLYYGAYVTKGKYSTVTCPTQGGTTWVASGAHFQYKA